MIFIDILKMAFNRMKKRQLRTLLTVLQVSMGIAAVAIVFNVLFGLADVLQEAQVKGLQRIYRFRIERNFRDDFYRNNIDDKHLLEDIRENVDTIEYISPFSSDYDQLLEKDGVFYRARKLAYVGPDFHKLMELKITRGSFFTQSDYEQGAKVCVISKGMAQILFGKEDPVGYQIQIYRYWYGAQGALPAPIEYTIIGVFDSGKIEGGFDEFQDNQILIPASIKHGNFSGNSAMEGTLFKIKPGKVNATQAAISAIVQDEYGRDVHVVLYPTDYSIKFMAKAFSYISGLMGAFCLLIVAISSIGILSTMMVNTLERTRLIGIEKALGASKGIILLELNIEAILISALGGVLGLAVARLLTDYIFDLFEILPFSLEAGLHPKAAIASLVIAVLSGWVFGLFPAIQASKLSPSEILSQR